MKECRKHISQMTSEDIIFLKNKVRVKGKPQLTDYCKDKMKLRGIKEWQVKKAIKEGELIEYHYVNPFEQRVLLRGTPNKRGNVVCVVYDVHTRDVVTVYYNKFNDNHKTLNMDRYLEDIDITHLVNMGNL